MSVRGLTARGSAVSFSVLGRSPGLYAGETPGAVARAAFATLDASSRVVDAAPALPVAHATRPMRIAVFSPGRWAESIINSPGVLASEWLAITGAASIAEALSPARTMAIDLIITRATDGTITLETPLPPPSNAVGPDDHAPAWEDWSTPLPLSYATVFPVRLDCARVTIAGDAIADAPELVRAMVEAAALLSRSPARLTRDQVHRGRAPVLAPAASAPTQRPAFSPVHDRDSISFAAQVEALVATRDALFERCLLARESVWTGVAQVAARIAGAWAALDTGTISHDEARLRRSVLEWSAAALPDDPATLLRLGAARIATVDDSAALLALDRASARILDALKDPSAPVSAPIAPSDHTAAFVHAELERATGLDDARLGRVAAGLCMLASTCKPEHAPFVLDDLREDMIKSTLLVGLDQDRRVLEDTFERVRFARFGVPPSFVQQPADPPATDASAGDHAAPAQEASPRSSAAPHRATTRARKSASKPASKPAAGTARKPAAKSTSKPVTKLTPKPVATRRAKVAESEFARSADAVAAPPASRSTSNASRRKAA